MVTDDCACRGFFVPSRNVCNASHWQAVELALLCSNTVRDALGRGMRCHQLINDAIRFTPAFKAWFGMTPSRFRERPQSLN